jgi:hypothetical protein
MWRFFKKRRALKKYRTTLFHHLRDTYGRKLYYTTEEVKASLRDVGASTIYDCYAFGMFTERDVFDAYHAATGEPCDYDAMRTEIFAHVAHVNLGSWTPDAGCETSHHDSGHHDTGAGHHHHGGGWDGGGHHGGGDFGGGGHHH